MSDIITNQDEIREKPIVKAVSESIIPKSVETEVISISPVEGATNEDETDSTDGSFEIEVKEEKKHSQQSSPQKISSTTCFVPILKGEYYISNSVAYWNGKWGMGSNGKVVGITSDFSYSMPIPIGNGIHICPVSGTYQGYFWMKYTPPRKIIENKMELFFSEEGSKYRVTGGGVNRLGPYELEGDYDPATRELTCTKLYKMNPAILKTHSSSGRGEGSRSSTRYLNYLISGGLNIPEAVPQALYGCYRIHMKLMSHKWAGPFLEPVNPEALHIPDYFDIIKEPIDLGTIQQKLVSGAIQKEEEYLRLTRRVFDNAILYNKPQDDVAIMAVGLQKVFEKEYKKVQSIDSVLESDPSAILTRQRSIKRTSYEPYSPSLSKQYALRRSGSVEPVIKKTILDLPPDVKPYQYSILDSLFKRVIGANVSEKKSS